MGKITNKGQLAFNESIVRRNNTFVHCMDCGKLMKELAMPIHMKQKHNRVIHDEKVMAAIQDNPGLMLHEYDLVIGWHVGEASRSVVKLAKLGKVHTVQVGQSKRVFLGPDTSMKLVTKIEEKPAKKNGTNKKSTPKTISAKEMLAPSAEKLEVFLFMDKRFTVIEGDLFEVSLRKVN